MTWIRTVSPEQAEGGLREIYRRIAGARGGVANILRAQSLHPAALAAHFELYRTLLFGPSPLSRVQREMLATAVSAWNGCRY
jgi:alkylhydroperoxidase family enzyme